MISDQGVSLSALTWQGGDLQICKKDLQFLLIPFLFLFSAPNENPPLSSLALVAASFPCYRVASFPCPGRRRHSCSRATTFPCSRRRPPLLPRRPPLLWRLLPSRRLPCSGRRRPPLHPGSCLPLLPPPSPALAVGLPCSGRRPPLLGTPSRPSPDLRCRPPLRAAAAGFPCPPTSPASQPGLPRSTDLDGADCGGPGRLRQAPGRHGRPYNYGPLKKN
jgi:hypothetical protein